MNYKRNQISLRIKYGFPIQLFFYAMFPEEEATIITVLPEFQPESHLLKNTICVGATFDENIRTYEMSSVNEDSSLNKLLDSFEIKNPVPLVGSFLQDNYKCPVSFIYITCFIALINSTPLKQIGSYFNLHFAWHSFQQ
jgi:hypothetical protein